MQDPAFVLYTDSSPNGFKITIALEEMGLPYRLVHVNIATKTSWHSTRQAASRCW